jgi:predicted Na+-dependent transporter
MGAKALRVKHETTVSIMMMGTTKNWSMAGGLLLAFYSERSAIPPSIFVFFAIFMIVWLEYRFRKRAPS